jgi:hypothetical protein
MSVSTGQVMLRIKTKVSLSSILNTTILTDLGLNLGISSDKPVTTCQSQGKAPLWFLITDGKI